MKLFLLISAIIFSTEFCCAQVNIDSLKDLINNAKNESSKTYQKEQLADAYYWNAQYPKSLEIYLQLLKNAQDSMNTTRLAILNFHVAKIHYYFRNGKSNETSMPFFLKALKLGRQYNDSIAILRTCRGIGAIMGENNKYDSAIYYLNIANKTALSLKEYDDASNISSVLGDYYLNHTSDTSQAIAIFNNAYKYAMISNQKEPIAFSLLKVSYGFILKKQYQKAEDSLIQALKIYEEFKLNDGLLNVLSYQISLYKKTNDYQKLSSTYEKLLNVNQQVYNDDVSSALAEVQTKYETEKKEKEISLLTAQTDIQTLQLQSNQYAMMGGGVIAILFIISTIALYSLKNYKLKTQFAQEKEIQQKSRFKAVIDAEEKERKRIAQELHDGLGQLLSTARLNVSVMEEDDESKNKQVNNSLKLIDDAVSEIRNISHNMMPNALISIGFEAALNEQSHLINDANKVKIHLKLPDEKLKLEESKAISLYRIIQEILNNALKFSEANNIWIGITLNRNLQITIKDDGIGFDTKMIENSTGIGWGNIISRTDLLNGELDIQSEIGKGSMVSLKLAV